MKKRILFFLMALSLFLFLTSGTVKAAGEENYADTLNSDSTSSSIKIPSTGLPNPSGGIKTILDNVLNWLLGILGIIGIIGFVISGIMYLTSAGSDEGIKRAKKGMTMSITGVVVGLGGYILVQAIEAALNVSSSQF